MHNNGMPIVVSPLVPEFVQAVKANPCGGTDKYLAEFNAWLLERFGMRRHIVIMGSHDCHAPQHLRLFPQGNRAMKRITRRQARAWLAPMRACFGQIKTGEVDSIRGYAVTRLHDQDDYARIDFCCAGFSALLKRLCPELDTAPLDRVEKKLAAGTPLTMQEVDAALSLFNQSENALIRHSAATVKSAVLAEQIAIEIDALGLNDSPTTKEQAA